VIRPLHSAILDHDHELAAELAVDASVSATARTAALKLAWDASDLPIYVTLLRIFEADPESKWGDLLIDYIYHLSEDNSCTSWLSNAEFLTWAGLQGDAVDTPWIGFLDLSETLRTDLRFLADRAGGWPLWTTGDAPKIVAHREWTDAYSRWRQQQDD